MFEMGISKIYLFEGGLMGLGERGDFLLERGDFLAEGVGFGGEGICFFGVLGF